jgi:hypothetical protein
MRERGIMVRYAGLIGGAMLAAAAMVAAGEASAQPGVQNPGREIVLRRQYVIASYREELRRYEINGRSFATQRDCDRLMEVLAELKRIAELDTRQVLLIPEQTLNEFKAEAKRLHSFLSSYYLSLAGQPCPPNATQTAATGLLNVTPWRPYFQIGGGVSSTQDIQVGNGNFNTKLDATGAQFDGTLSVPMPPGVFGPNSTFQARFYVFNGNGSTNLSGIPGTFLQANGDSRNTVTFGGRIGGGLAYTVLNGGRLELKAAVASVPLHELRFHAGQMATIEPRNYLNVTAGGSLTIPFSFGNAPRPFPGVAPLRDSLRRQQRLYRG